MTTFVEETRRGTLRVVLTGDYAGEPELIDALDAVDSPIDLVGQCRDVRDAAPHLAATGVDAVLHVAGDVDGLVPSTLAADVASLRTSTLAPVILLVANAHPDVVEPALAAGVDDVLALPQPAGTIAFAIRKAARGAGRATPPAGQAPGSRGRVLTVFSPKGGTGKTVLSTNLATLLAKESDREILLIDLDLQFGDAAIMLGLDPERTLYELVNDPGALDGGKLRRFTTRHKSGLEVLAAPMRPEDAELVTEAKVLRLLEVARETYDIVIVDTSPFFYGPMLALLQPTDQLLLLCGLDVPTLKNVKLSLRTLDQLGFPPSRRSIVLNRVTPDVGLTKEHVEEALGVDVRFEIPNDPAVAPAVNRGSAVVLGEANSAFSHAISAIADSLEPTQAALSSSLPAPRRRWLGRRRALEGRTA